MPARAARRVVCLAVGVALTSAVAAGTSRRAEATPSAGCSQRVVTRVVQVPDASAANGRREVRIYRPPGPDSRRLPVLYLLAGLPGTDEDFARNGLIEQMDARLCRGQRFVAAVPDGHVLASDGTSAYDTEWGDDPAGRFDLESFVTTAMITAVEGADRRPAALRALGGFSMGAFAAASITLRHPQLYRSVLAIAGYFHLDDPDHALGRTPSQQRTHDPDALVGRARGMHFFLADGSADTLPVSDGESQRYASLLRRHGVDTRLVLVPGVHSLALVYEALPAALTYWRSRLPGRAG